jgi:hypothetical protein
VGSTNECSLASKPTSLGPDEISTSTVESGATQPIGSLVAIQSAMASAERGGDVN